MNAPRTTEDAANMLLVSIYLAASTAPVVLDTPVMALPARVRHLFNWLLRRTWLRDLSAGLHFVQIIESFFDKFCFYRVAFHRLQ